MVGFSITPARFEPVGRGITPCLPTATPRAVIPYKYYQNNNHHEYTESNLILLTFIIPCYRLQLWVILRHSVTTCRWINLPRHCLTSSALLDTIFIDSIVKLKAFTTPWLRSRESNSELWIMRPACYRCTTARYKSL